MCAFEVMGSKYQNVTPTNEYNIYKIYQRLHFMAVTPTPTNYIHHFNIYKIYTNLALHPNIIIKYKNYTNFSLYITLYTNLFSFNSFYFL